MSLLYAFWVDDCIYDMGLLCFFVLRIYRVSFSYSILGRELRWVYCVMWYRDWVAFGCKQSRKIMRWGKWRIWLLLGRDGTLWYLIFFLSLSFLFLLPDSVWSLRICPTMLILVYVRVYICVYLANYPYSKALSDTYPNLNQFPCLTIFTFF